MIHQVCSEHSQLSVSYLYYPDNSLNCMDNEECFCSENELSVCKSYVYLKIVSHAGDSEIA